MDTGSDGSIELLYDNGHMFQSCLAVVRAYRKIGQHPTAVRMNANTATAMLNQSDFVFGPDARVFIRIADLPVKITASLIDNYIVVDLLGLTAAIQRVTVYT